MKRLLLVLSVTTASTAWAGAQPAKNAAPPLTLACTKEAQDGIWQAWRLTWNGHSQSEIQPVITKAMAADPTCTAAQFLAASWIPAADSQKKLDEAVAASAKLPETDRTFIAYLDAQRKGDGAAAIKHAEKLGTLEPKSFLPPLVLAVALRDAGKLEESQAAAKKATELGPDEGACWNQLAYANMFLHKSTEAIAALKRYTHVAPNEPNAHDSLGDALLAAGKLDDGEAAFKKAIDVSGGKFFISYTGQAGVHFINGDFDGGRALVAKWKAAEPDAQAKLDADFWTAWSYVTQGKAAEALAAYDAIEKDAAKANALYAMAQAPHSRADALVELGNYADASKALSAAEKADLSKLSPAAQRAFKVRRAGLRAVIAARTAKVSDAEKALKTVDAELKGADDDTMLQDRARVVRGEVAMAKKDPKAAVAALKGCQKEFTYCQWHLAEAQEAAGDAAGAQATRDLITKVAFRDIWYAYARSKATPKK